MADIGRWNFKREISLGNILTTLGVVAAGISYVISNETAHAAHRMRIEALQAATAEMKGADLRMDAKLEATVSRIEAQVQRVSDKLDRLIESPRRP